VLARVSEGGRWTTAEKPSIVEETYAPNVSVSLSRVATASSPISSYTGASVTKRIRYDARNFTEANLHLCLVPHGAMLTFRTL
jgi:hypothetical protein